MDGVEQIVTNSRPEYLEKLMELTREGWTLTDVDGSCAKFKNEFPVLVTGPTNYIRGMELPDSVELYAPGHGPSS